MSGVIGFEKHVSAVDFNVRTVVCYFGIFCGFNGFERAVVLSFVYKGQSKRSVREFAVFIVYDEAVDELAEQDGDDFARKGNFETSSAQCDTVAFEIKQFANHLQGGIFGFGVGNSVARRRGFGRRSSAARIEVTCRTDKFGKVEFEVGCAYLVEFKEEISAGIVAAGRIELSQHHVSLFGAYRNFYTRFDIIEYQRSHVAAVGVVNHVHDVGVCHNLDAELSFRVAGSGKSDKQAVK